jgi:hypothetical protein
MQSWNSWRRNLDHDQSPPLKGVGYVTGKDTVHPNLFAPAGAKNYWDWSAAPRAHPGQREHGTTSRSVTHLHRANTSLARREPRPPRPSSDKATRRLSVSTLSHEIAVTPTGLSLIGFTMLRAVSGILRTHRGRRGSGLGRHPAGAIALRRAGAVGLEAASTAPSPASAAVYRPVRSRPSTAWGITVSACAASLSLLAPVAQLSACAASLSPRPCGSTLSHLAGVGQCPLAIGHGRLVGLLAGVPDRRPVSPLSSTSACSGAGSGWHGCGWIADSAVNSEGLVPVALAFARACSAGPSPVWRIASVTRPRRSRGYRTERCLAGGRHHCGCAFGQVGSQPEPGPMGARSSLTGRWPQPASGLNRPVACSLSAGGAVLPPDTMQPTAQATRMPPARVPGGSGLGLITDCDHMGHGSGLARAGCARLTPAEQRA